MPNTADPGDAKYKPIVNYYNTMTTYDEKAVANVVELFKVLIATSGVVLSLLWGLVLRGSATSLVLAHIASAFLMLSVITSLFGLQYIVAKFEAGVQRITKECSVAGTFVTASISFIVGMMLLFFWAISSIKPTCQ